jgi:hypothetical protein
MTSKKLCDGSTVEWEPVLQDEECGECGHVTGQWDSAEPEFHGKTVHKDESLYCERCGEEFIGYVKATKIALEIIIPKIKEDEKSAPFYSHIKGRDQG